MADLTVWKDGADFLVRANSEGEEWIDNYLGGTIHIIDPDDFAAGKITVIGVERKERRNGAAIVEPPHEDFETMRMEAVEDGLEVRVL